MKPARAGELVAKREVIARGHRLHQREVPGELDEDGLHAADAAHGRGERLLGHVRAREQLAHADHLAQHELEPELVDLVHRDEHDLVVGQLGLALGAARLERKQRLDADVAPVGQRLLAHGRP
ncbi:MAG TPA: hypothetical protein VE987_09925 [Polyangiaceae bacterium]|nr:hypothetical protein [Polyangiaceae bacterium]